MATVTARNQPWVMTLACIRRVALLGVSFAVATADLDAQTRIVVASEPACQKCRITLTPVLRIGSANATHSYSSYVVSIVRDTKGHYLVGPRDATKSGEALFDLINKDGRNVESLGAAGQGPREFTSVYGLYRWAPDTVLVVADNKIALMLFNGDVVSERPRFSSRASSVAPIGSGELIASSPTVDGRTLRLLQIITLDREVPPRFFGPILDGPEVAPSSSAFRKLALNREGKIWALNQGLYQLELWRRDGQLDRVLSREASWFETRGVSRSLVAGITEQDGLLWTVINVPKRTIELSRDAPMTNAWLNQNYDTRIEVIDPATGQLVVSQRFPGYIRGFFDGILAIGSSEDRAGTEYLNVWRVQLVRR